jgi:hypothetical protein
MEFSNSVFLLPEPGDFLGKLATNKIHGDFDKMVFSHHGTIRHLNHRLAFKDW